MSVLNKINVISSIGYDSKICQNLSQEGQESIAGVFSTYAYSWLTCGPDLFILNNRDGVIQSYWTFGENLQDDLEITCAVELPLEGCAIPLLILGISSENVNLICFFNPNTRKILRTIDIIYPVRTICIIEDGTNEVYPLNNSLTPTEGLIAVGCAEGTVLLIDLCRSVLCKAVNGDFRFYSTEENPSEVVFVGINSVTSGGFSQKIVESRKKKNCVSVILTDPSDDGITALLYSIESAVLFVGTSSGSFHMWNMSSLSCLFRSPATNRAVISLSLLEPCDDPRHNLYLWICFEEYAQVAMYCISFSSKFYVHGYGVYYQNFESAGLVYRFTLGMEVDMLAKRPICSQAVAKLVPKNLVRCISLPEAEGTHLRLFTTAYEIIDKGQISIRALIFDLNQWYRDQMPEEGISTCLDSIELDCKSLRHLQIDPNSLTLYQCVRPQEQHFHPTSFDFQVWCIEEEGVRCLEKLGLQTQWLRNICRLGPDILVEPTQVFLGALAAGLLASFVDPPDPEANDLKEERCYVLTICLENRIIKFIENCAQVWNNGHHTVKGCSVQFILNWLWSLHRTYKDNGNKICIPLFDQSGMKFDVSEKRSLQHCKSLLNTVQSVYINISNRYKNNIIISGIEEKLTAMSLVRLYFDCCLKLISVNLLPEPNDQGRPSDSLVYHFDNINTYAIKRRKEGPFLGDSLLGRTDAEKQWLEEGGTGLYPPPSIQSVLRFCLHPSPSYANKMSLLLYLFMDIINSYSPIRSQPVLDKIKNFQHLMRISEVQYKIVAGCWYFDHSLFDEGVDLLFDPRVLSVDLNEDQHRGILYLLASERQEKLALQYLRMKSPTLHLISDMRMELNLLLSNGLVNEAFLFQRKHPEMRETLLIEFFEGCIERKQLGQVFGLNLDFKEEAALMKYLRSSSLKQKGDLQVLLLLSKAKYTEAMFLNDKLNSSINGPKSRIETDTRDMIVRGVTGSLNTISRHIANEMKTYRPPPAGSHPRPLSSLIKVRNGPDGQLFQTDSKVLLSTVAKSTRHLSDFVNSCESGQRRKREEKDDFDLENEPSRKRLKLLDSPNDIQKVTPLSGKWWTSPGKSSASQKSDVMELVGTPLVKKRSKRLSPQSRPSSILKGKTPEKSIIPEDLGETPKKTIRFALPENEIQITGRKPLRESETTVSNKTSINTVNSEDDSAIAVTREDSNFRGLGKLSARKSLHGSDSLNSTVTGHDSSVIENIKDRLRSSSKKKVLEDGVNWHEIAEASKPRVLFTQGASKITSVTKLDKTPSSTPISQVLLDITVTSAEKKYLDSPSRGEETSPVTENLFNTTLLPKALFSSVNKERGTKEKSPEEISMHAAFLDRYKQLRNKNITSSNTFVTPKKDKEKGVRFEEQPFDEIFITNTVEQFKSTETSSSTKITIDEDILPKKESIVNENLLNKNNDELDDQLAEQKNSELLTGKEELSNESLLEEQEVASNGKQNKLSQDVENSLHGNDPSLKDDVYQFEDEDGNVLESKENLIEWSGIKITQVEGNSPFEEPIDNSHKVYIFKSSEETQIGCVVISDDKTCLNNSKLSEAFPSKKSNLVSENELSNDSEKLRKEVEIPVDCQSDTTKDSVEDNSEEVSSNYAKDCEEIIEIVSDDEEEDDNEDKQSFNESLTEEEAEGISGESSEEIEEEDVSENEEIGSDNDGSLPNVSSISSDGDDGENLDRSISDNFHDGKSSEIIMEEDENVDNKKESGETPIVVLSDDSGDEISKKKKKGYGKKLSNVETREPKIEASSELEQDYDDVSDSEVFGLKDDKNDYIDEENSKTKASSQLEQDYEEVSDSEAYHLKIDKTDYVCGETSKTKASSELEQDFEDVSDSDVFDLKNDNGDYKNEENSEDDMWIGLDDKESIVRKSMNNSKQELIKDSTSASSSNEKLVTTKMPAVSSYLIVENSELKPVPSVSLDDDHVVQVVPSFAVNEEPEIEGVHSIVVDEEPAVQAVSSFDVDDGPDMEAVRSIAVDEDPVVQVVSSFADEEGPDMEAVSSIAVDEDPVVQVVSSFADEEGSEIEAFPSSAINEGSEIADVSSVAFKSHMKAVVSEEDMLSEEIPPVSINNEKSCNEKKLNNTEEVLDLKEDFQSIERNWTQQIEEEMKQDSVLLKIESDNNDAMNMSGRQLLDVDSSKNESKELTGLKSVDNPDRKSHSIKIQNNILVCEESGSLEIDGKRASMEGTTNDALGKDDLSHFDKSESHSPKIEKKHEDDLTVTHLNVKENDHQNTKEDCHINVYEGNNVTEIPATLSTPESLTIDHGGDSFKIDEGKHFSSHASSANISSGNTVNEILSYPRQSVSYKFQENSTFNKNETLLKEKNASFSASEKSKSSSSILSEINLIPVEAEANKLSENIGECSHKSLVCDSVTSVQDHSHTILKVNKNDNEINVSVTLASKSQSLIETEITKKETQQNCTLKKDNSTKTEKDNGNRFVSSDSIQSQNEMVKPANEISEATLQSEVQPTKSSTIASDHAKDKIGAQSGETDFGSCAEVCEIKDVHSLREISDQFKIKSFDPVAGSEVAKDSDTVINQFSYSPSSCDQSSEPNVDKESNFEPFVKVIDSTNISPAFEKESSNNSNEHNVGVANASELTSVVCEKKALGDDKSTIENISLCVNKDVSSDIEPLDCQLNNAKIDVSSDSLISVALNPLKKDINHDIQKVTSVENIANVCSEKKSFFFGKEDIDTYIRSTKATFQIGGRVSLPEEDEPVDPMEIAMIEDEDKTLVQPSTIEPDIELSLHLSPDHIRKPKKVDQGIVTDNSYLQRRARKLRKSVKKLLTDTDCNKELENKIIVSSEYHGSDFLSVGKELKCISVQTSEDIAVSESDEELTDYTKIPRSSQKSEQKKIIARKIRQSSEPPLTHKEDLKRKSSLRPQLSDEFDDEKEEPNRDKRPSQEQNVKGILKKNYLTENFDEELKTQSKIDRLPVRRSRRLSECVTETNELMRNQFEKDQYINSRRKSRGYSEEPDFYRVSSHKDEGNSDNEKEAAGKNKISKQRRSRRYSEQPEMQPRLDENLEKRKVKSSSDNISDEYTLKRRSKRFSEEPESSNKYHDEGRRNAKKSDDCSDFKQSEEPEIHGILKKSSKQHCKTSLSCEALNEMKHYGESDSRQEFRKSRSQSEEPGELEEIPRKRYRRSRRSSYTYETAADFHCHAEEIPFDYRKVHKYSEDTEIQDTLKKRSSNKSKSSLLSEVPSEMETYKVCQSKGSGGLRKHSEGEIQGILKKTRKECRSSDNEIVKLKILDGIVPDRNRRSRRHSEEPDMLRTLKTREESSSQSSEIDKEFNVPESVRQIRRHSEEPEVRGILKRRSSINRKSLCNKETASDFKLELEVDHLLENRESKELSEESGVRGILKKSKSSRRRNSNTGESDKDIYLERGSPEHKNSHFLEHESHKAENKRSISRKIDSINSEKTPKDYDSNEECLSNKNTLKNQTCSHVSGTKDKNNEKTFSDDVIFMEIDAEEPDKALQRNLHPSISIGKKDARSDDKYMEKIKVGEKKEIDSLSLAEQVSKNKRTRRSNLLPFQEEPQNAEESPAKVRRRSSSTVIAKEESLDVISLPEGEIKATRKSQRRTPDKKQVNAKILAEEKKRKVEPEDLKFVPKRLEYSDDESPGKKKSRSLIDFPIKRNRRLPRPALEDIREEDEDLLKNKSLDDFHIEEMKKKASSKKSSVSKLVIGDSDADSDVSTPELWKKDGTKEKRLTRTQQKQFLISQQLTSISEVESPSTSSPRRNTRKKVETTDSPLKTPTRSSLRLQKKPPSETE